MSGSGQKRDPKSWRPATQLVHGGTLRSQFGETSEAIFLTQGFVYPSMEAAEARMKGDEPGYVYSRFANPTVAMFEERMALFEGAEAARATASGMAAVTASPYEPGQGGRSCRGRARPVRRLPLHRRGSAAALRRRLDAWSTAPISPNGALRCGPRPRSCFSKARPIPVSTSMTSARSRPIAHEHGARLVVDNVFATPVLAKAAGAWGRSRRLFGDQAHRRAWSLSRRRHPRRQGFDRD